jgi:hypothetical protein
MLAIRPNTKLAAAAPRMARLLLRLEEDAYADARECPFCIAPEGARRDTGLSHSDECELEKTLRAAGLRRAESEGCRTVIAQRARASGTR